MDCKGLLIVNEGPDGSGKATQTALLCDRLRAEGFRVEAVSFPTYSKDAVAGLIRYLLRERPADWRAISWQVKATLYACNRLRFLERLSSWLQEKDTVVVCDRYVPSNQAHLAGYVDNPTVWEIRFRWIEWLEYDLCALPRPDVVILHAMPRMTAEALLAARGQRDAHEADTAYLSRVAAAYEQLAARDPKRWISVPAEYGGRLQTPPEVHERVWRALTSHAIWQVFAARAHALA